MQPKFRPSLIAALCFSLSFTFLTSSGQDARATDYRNLPLTGNTIADIADKASPAVVHLEMRRKQNMSASGLPSITEFFFNGQRLLNESDDDQGKAPNGSAPNKDGKAPDKPGTGGGSKPKGMMEQLYTRKPDIATGFIIRPDGYIVTNFHAVDGQDKIKVTLYDKRSLEATVVGTDSFADLAVIKVDAKDLPVLNWGSSSALRPGEFAVAIGSPLGDDHSVTMGIISAVGRTESDVNGNINFVQTDAAINPGNSGGPLLNLNGEVVGVNTAIRPMAQNIAYSIPADTAKAVSDELISKGKVDRPWLGVVMDELDEAFIKGTELPEGTKGVRIRDFVQGSPGQASGLLKNDIIQKVDGKQMLVPKDVKDYVTSHKSGDVLQFSILRNKASQNIAVNVGTYPRSTTINRRLR